MVIREFENIYFDDTAILLALFRRYLHSFKGIKSPLDIESAREELNSFIRDPNYPIFVCLDEQEIIGYMILKIDGCVWVEQI